MSAPAQPPPFHAAHLAAGARIVDFAGRDMPVNCDSQIDEHHAVLPDAAIFDVSRMNVFTTAGEGGTTSSSFSPMPEKSIASTRLPLSAQTGEEAEVEARGKRQKARTTRLPFVRNGKPLI